MDVGCSSQLDVEYFARNVHVVLIYIDITVAWPATTQRKIGTYSKPS